MSAELMSLNAEAGKMLRSMHEHLENFMALNPENARCRTRDFDGIIDRAANKIKLLS
jgi:hypothetical protein